MNVLCGRSSAERTPQAKEKTAVSSLSVAAVSAVDPLTHAFLSKRRPPPPSSSPSTLPSSFVQSVLPGISMMSHSQRPQHHTAAVPRSLLLSGSYGGPRPTPTPPPVAVSSAFPAAATPPASSTGLISQSDYRCLTGGDRVNVIRTTNTTTTVNDPRGSAHALLALMEAKRQTQGQHQQRPQVMKQEKLQRHCSSSSNEDALTFSSNASTASSASHSSVSGDGEPFSSSPRENGSSVKRGNDDAESDTDSVRTERSTTSSIGKKGLKRKFRKATHTVRKEEKERLLFELEQLQLQMDELKRRALDGSSSQTRQDKNLTNAVLRDTLQQQLNNFADAQVLFSEYGMTQVISPIALPIRLGLDRNDRMATLSAIKERKLELSRAFLKRRCGSLDPRKPYCEDQRFETPNGDYCAVRFSILQFEGVQSVKQVFDALHFYFCNIEISISEKLGNITIREDDDMQDKSISQNRLVGTTASRQLLESNTVMFSGYVESDPESGGREYALMSAEFVDEDELYPYRPDQRLRKDINAILQLTSYTRMVRNMFDEDVEELVVVLMRWSHSRLHRPEFQVPNAAMHEMRENMERWGESMHKTLRETLYSDA